MCSVCVRMHVFHHFRSTGSNITVSYYRLLLFIHVVNRCRRQCETCNILFHLKQQTNFSNASKLVTELVEIIFITFTTQSVVVSGKCLTTQ